MSDRSITDSFVLGINPYPDWFTLLDKEGRVLYETGQDGELKRVTIKHPVKYMTAEFGDTIMNMSGNVIVVPKSAADKYMRRR